MTGTGDARDDSLYRDALEVLILTATIAKEGRQDTEERLKGFGAALTAAQYRVLRQLQQERHTIKSLSQRLMVEPASLVPMVDTLERHGFIRRGTDPHDRRRTPLELTDAGLEHLRRVPFVHEDDLIARYLGQLSGDERQTFLRQLRDLVKSLHGHDMGVRQIAGAVNAYFDFGQQQRKRPPARRRAPPAQQKETPST